MAFKKYTTCIEPEHYVLDFGTHLLGYAQLVLFALSVGFAAFAIITIAGGPVAIIAVLAFLTVWISVLLWYLHGRLICLGPDDRNCAIIGAVKSHGQSDPSWGEKYGDDDYTMNLWLAPGPLTDSEPEEEYWKAPQGHLVAENPEILNINKHYPDRKYVKFLHCEFEGSGIHDRLNALYGIVATLLAALLIPGFWIVSIILGLLLIFGKGIFGSKGQPGSGTPLDVGVNPGSLDGGAIVVVAGSWIYDSGHEGWNEIHPVMACQVIGHLPADGWKGFVYTDEDTQLQFTLDTVDNVVRFREFWCGMLKGAQDAEDGGNRDDPANDWVIHPLVDGCKPPPIIL
ncbi:hypothetical protein JQ628_09515 [Bradyrhizobium lablabi]|uniref:hypothetical protein n=1 Tax=Bradyrhizobium lablabi TaxID=722472 RepID=UPI001BAC5F39|nr:hypothetical protein [Bradyrhizobium lablabi]MBR1121746.1 hypothetical protein [Bradyrhizobium lablabi]